MIMMMMLPQRDIELQLKQLGSNSAIGGVWDEAFDMWLSKIVYEALVKWFHCFRQKVWLLLMGVDKTKPKGRNCVGVLLGQREVWVS